MTKSIVDFMFWHVPVMDYLLTSFFFKLHGNLEFKTMIPYSEDGRPLLFFSDPLISLKQSEIAGIVTSGLCW